MLVAALFSGNIDAQTTLKTSQDSASYAFGMLVGKNLMRQLPPDLNIDIVMKAMGSTLKDESLTRASYALDFPLVGRVSRLASGMLGNEY